MKTYEEFINEKIKIKAIELAYDEPEEENLVFKADTKNGKYTIEVFIDPKYKTYDTFEYIGDKTSGSGSGLKPQDAEKKLKSMLKNAKEIDNINYIISVNKIW